MRTVTVCEHDYVPISQTPADGELSLYEVKLLENAQSSMGVTAFSWVGRHRIKISQYVGLIATPIIRLEILPKIERAEHIKTRGTLVRMVGAALSIPIYDGDITPLSSQDQDLLDIIILVFARRLISEIRKGLNRNYRRRYDDLPRLRGKLNITRQFTKYAATPQTLACEFDEFSADIAMNQLLLCAVSCLLRQTKSENSKKLLLEAQASFSSVSFIDVSEVLKHKLIQNRKNERWLPCLKLARLLLEALYQTAHSGRQDGVALLFDMNKLFEAYVTRVAQKVMRPLGFDVLSQKPQRVLVRGSDGIGTFRTKPDIYICNDNTTVIVDTKWKSLDFSNSAMGVSQADAYQMHAYAQVYGATACILLYPDLSSRSGLQKTWFFQHGTAHLEANQAGKLCVGTIDILNERDMGRVLLSLVDGSTDTEALSVKSDYMELVN